MSFKQFQERLKKYPELKNRNFQFGHAVNKMLQGLDDNQKRLFLESLTESIRNAEVHVLCSRRQTLITNNNFTSVSLEDGELIFVLDQKPKFSEQVGRFIIRNPIDTQPIR